jgi:hypothetical protein
MFANFMPAAAAKACNLFVPHPLECVPIGKATVKLYPIITSLMQPPKCAHAFQVNKTVLALPGIDRHAMLNTLGAQLSLSATANGTLGNRDHHLNHN